MKALFIGSDPLLFDTTSTAYGRIYSYAEAIGSVHVLMRSNLPNSIATNGPLTIQGVQAGKLDATRKLAVAGRAVILAKGVEVVSAQDPFEHGWAAKEAVKGTSAKLHIQVHTDFLSPWFVRGAILRSPMVTPPVKNRARLLLADQVLPKADGIRVVSQRVKDSILKKYGNRVPEPTVLPIAVGSVPPERVPLPALPFPFALMTVGRLEPEKRIEDIIEALSRIREKYPAVGLVVVGDGSERSRLEKMVKDKNLIDRVVFLGAPKEAWGLMRSAQGYIQASAYEGYGRTLIEAALARVPIISSDVGIIGEVLKGYEDALVTPPGDPTNLAYHMIALLEDRPSTELRIRSAEAKALAHVRQYENLPALIAADLAKTLGATSV